MGRNDEWHIEHFANEDVWDVTYGPLDDPSSRFSILENLTEEECRMICKMREAYALLNKLADIGIDEVEDFMESIEEVQIVRHE